MKKIIYFIWDYFIPNFIRNFIKYIIYKIKYKNKIGIKTIDNLSIGYLLSNKIKLGKKVDLGNGNIISGKINIGDYTYLNGPNTRLSGSDNYKINIGKFCSISWGVQIITNNFHNKNKLTTSDCYELHKYNNNNGGDVIIGNDVWIGCNVIILQGINIGNGAIIGAGSIVTKNIPSYAISVGNPAKIINYRFDKRKILDLEKSKWWNWNIEKIKENYDLNFLNN